MEESKCKTCGAPGEVCPQCGNCKEHCKCSPGENKMSGGENKEVVQESPAQA